MLDTLAADRRSFLRAICAAPDDDTPRLIFADWLEEHGEPERAAFIRDQIASGEDYADGVFVYRRGFPHRVRMSGVEWVQWADAILRDNPTVREYEPTGSAPLEWAWDAGGRVMWRFRGRTCGVYADEIGNRPPWNAVFEREWPHIRLILPQPR